MKALARLVCLSALFIAPVTRIGADDSKQFKSLFDEVRDAIPKLKPGMTFDEAKHILMINKLKYAYLSAGYWSGRAEAHYHYEIRGNSSQTLMVYVRTEKNSREFLIIDAELRDGERVVAGFDANKK